MTIKAIITGDIIHSTKIKKRDELLKSIKKICNSLLKRKCISQFEIYRGDEFQIEVTNPESALKTVLIIRAYLQKRTVSQATTGNLWDARIAIGLGTTGYTASKITESTGEAFEKSGKGLDYIKSTSHRLILRTPWQVIDEEMAVSLRFTDAIIKHWSKKSAEVAYLHWFHKYNQETIAKKIGISQPAVNNRFQAAQIKNIDFMLKRYESLIREKTEKWKKQ